MQPILKNLPNQTSSIHLLIIHTWGLGDLILLTPVINVIHQQYPHLQVSFLFFQSNAAAPIKRAPWLKEIHYCRLKVFQLVRMVMRLRNFRFEISMVSSGVTPWKAGLLQLFLRSGLKVNEYGHIPLPYISGKVRFNPALSRTQSNYRLLESVLRLPGWAQISADPIAANLLPTYFLSKADCAFADEYYAQHNPEGKRTLGVHPGCLAKNSYRRWPVEYFIQLLRMIQQTYDHQIIVIAGPDEQREGEQIHQAVPSLLLSGESLDHVAAIISKLDCFINTDSGLGHIAACFRIPSLTLFGAGDARQTAPFSDTARVIHYEMDCAPCAGKKSRSCAAECMKLLTPELVFAQLRSVLA